MANKRISQLNPSTGLAATTLLEGEKITPNKSEKYTVQELANFIGGLPIARYVYLVNDASDQTKMGGTNNHVYITAQTAYTAASALATSLGDNVIILVLKTNEATVGTINTTGGWNPLVGMVGLGRDISKINAISITDGSDIFIPILKDISIVNGISTRNNSGPSGNINITVENSSISGIDSSNFTGSDTAGNIVIVGRESYLGGLNATVQISSVGINSGSINITSEAGTLRINSIEHPVSDNGGAGDVGGTTLSGPGKILVESFIDCSNQTINRNAGNITITVKEFECVSDIYLSSSSGNGGNIFSSSSSKINVGGTIRLGTSSFIRTSGGVDLYNGIIGGIQLGSSNGAYGNISLNNVTVLNGLDGQIDASSVLSNGNNFTFTDSKVLGSGLSLYFNGSYIANGAFTVQRSSFFDFNILLQGNSFLDTVILENSTFNQTLVSSSSTTAGVNILVIRDCHMISFGNGAAPGTNWLIRSIRNNSVTFVTFPVAIPYTEFAANLSAHDLETGLMAREILISGTGNISSIDAAWIGFEPIKFFASPGDVVTFVHSPGTLLCEGGVNAVIDGNNGDWVEFKRNLLTGVIYQTNIGQY